MGKSILEGIEALLKVAPKAAKKAAPKAAELPMDEASRMARAKEMGFDTSRPVYHGTDTNFRAFDPNRAIGTQFWSTTDRAAIEAGEVGAAGRGVIKELYHRIKNPAGWDEYDKFSTDELIARGYDGLALPDPNGHVTYVAFEPNQYRDVRARFDPAKRNSGDLLAGVGAGALALPALNEAVEDGMADGGLAGYDKGGVAKKGAGAVTRAARKAAKPDDLARATILKGVGEDTLFGKMLPTTIDDTLYEMDRAYPGLIKNWEETVARSKATGDEHGFYTSAPGNPTTIMRGDDRSMPPEYTDGLMRLAVPAPNGIAFDLHTHPRNTALPSLGDFKVESAVADGSFQHGVTRKSPFPFMSGIEAVAPKSASRRLNIVDARLANASQRRDLSDIIADHLNDDPDFFKRINASKDLTEIMGGMPDHKLISAKEWFANNALVPILTERALARQGRGFNLVEFGPETPMFNIQRKGRDDVPATRPGEAADTLRQLDLFVKNKVGYADGGAARFDPEGDGYDDEGAARAGMQPDAEGHMGSVAPTDERDVYRMLKGRAHPTWDRGVAAENMRGSAVEKREDGRYYSVPYAPGGGYADGAHMSDAEMDRMRARALAGRRGAPDLSGETRVDPTLMGGLRRLGADLPAMARDVPGATEMIGSGLARFGGALYDELGDWAADYGQRMYDDPLTTLSGSVRDISETLLPTTTLNRLADVATGVEGAEMPGLMELGEDALTLMGFTAGRKGLAALARSRAFPAAIGAGVVAAPSEAEAGPKLKTMSRIADEARAAAKPMPLRVEKGFTPSRRPITDPVDEPPFPRIWESPRTMVAEAAEAVAPEDAALKELFGVTRADLYETSKRAGNRPGMIKEPPKPRGSDVGEAVTTPRNTQRMQDIIAEAQRHPDLYRGMHGWYVMDPAYQRLKTLHGEDEAKRLYDRFNTFTAMASPGSPVEWEIERGAAANMLANKGRFDDFVRYGGIPGHQRGADFPADMVGMNAHPYHRTAQALPMQNYVDRGAVEMGSPKVPLYMQSSSVPDIGFQTNSPVPDAHFTRLVGVADARRSANPGASMKTPEYLPVRDWWRNKVTAPMGIEAVPGQAVVWGAGSRATGVDSPIGAPKLELLAQHIMRRAKETGMNPHDVRDAILSGNMRADGGKAQASGPSTLERIDALLGAA